MSMLATLNRLVFKRTSTFLLAAAGISFFFERSFDQIADTIYEKHNKGRLWEDIKHKYE